MDHLKQANPLNSRIILWIVEIIEIDNQQQITLGVSCTICEQTYKKKKNRHTYTTHARVTQFHQTEKKLQNKTNYLMELLYVEIETSCVKVYKQDKIIK